MPEVIRFFASRLRHFVADRRSAKRFSIQLPCTVGLTTDFVAKNVGLRDSTLEGVTSDLSVTGLSLRMPAVHIGGHYLTGASGTLRILLELPDGPILLDATAVRYERVENDESQPNYLIGVHIKDMNAQDRVRFIEFVKHL